MGTNVRGVIEWAFSQVPLYPQTDGSKNSPSKFPLTAGDRENCPYSGLKITYCLSGCTVGVLFTNLHFPKLIQVRIELAVAVLLFVSLKAY